MSDIPIVQAEGLIRTYHLESTEVQALRGIDLSVPRGKMAAIMGRSGSGKTTLLNLIGGLDKPDEGTIQIEGKNLADLSEEEVTAIRRTRIGFIFQSFALIPTFSAMENVELPLRIMGLDPRERRTRTRACLDMVGLLKWGDHRPYEMSGGQQQRVAIARALANNPALILADEPTGELDTTTAREILDLFKTIIAEHNITFILVTHDPIIDEYADDVFEIEDGKIVKN